LIQFPYTTFHSGAQAGTEGKTTLPCKSGGSRVAAATQYQVPEIISHLALAPQSFAYFILFYFILFYSLSFSFIARVKSLFPLLALALFSLRSQNVSNKCWMCTN
jgi:hypothetical protein